MRLGMTRIFIETDGFRKRVDAAGDRNLLARIQHELLKDITAGDLVPSTGGIRKMRIADEDRGKGKRGGYRVLYLDLADKQETYLLAIYDKGDKENISADERKVLKQLVKILKGIP